MQLNINIESTITAALESALAPDRIREQIEKQIAGTVDAAIKDAFREYSDFGKTVKEAVAGDVPHDLSLEGAANWNHAINQIIRERLAAVNNERIAQAINPMLDKLLVQPPKELKVSELVRKAAEMWGDIWKRDGSDRPSVEIEHSEGVTMDFYRIKMDPRQTSEAAAATAQFFVGQYRHALDPKRRLTIPSDWRAIVGRPAQVFVIPAVGEKHLYVFPANALAPRLQRVHSISMADPQGRNYLRIMGSRSELLTWDTQGRIRVRDELLAYAGVKSEAVLVGNWEGFEIWNPAAWTKVEASVGEVELRKATKYVGM